MQLNCCKCLQFLFQNTYVELFNSHDLGFPFRTNVKLIFSSGVPIFETMHFNLS